MNILITGATGFIGRHLCAHLTAQNHTVIALMRRSHELPTLQTSVNSLGGRGASIKALSGDLAEPKLGIAEPLSQVDAIVHLGARFAWQLEYETAYTTNVEGSLAAAELAREFGCRLVFVSGFMLENLQHLNQL